MSKDSDKPHAMQPEDTPELRALYRGFEENHLNPLWTQTANLMPPHPKPEAVPHVWEWEKLYELAKRSGDLVPVGRGGERRAIGLANPGLGGRAYISPTLWAAVQYLGPRENAPEHRHAQNAFRFVLEGEGVWTVVDGDPIHMSRGDLLLTPGWQFHGHQNISDKPMAWLDGLDISHFHNRWMSGFLNLVRIKCPILKPPKFLVESGCGHILGYDLCPD